MPNLVDDFSQQGAALLRVFDGGGLQRTSQGYGWTYARKEEKILEHNDSSPQIFLVGSLGYFLGGMAFPNPGFGDFVRVIQLIYRVKKKIYKN
jgi:hypothetical protein